MYWQFCSSVSLLLRRECCTFSNGEYVKAGLSLLEKWITDVTEEVNAILHSFLPGKKPCWNWFSLAYLMCCSFKILYYEYWIPSFSRLFSIFSAFSKSLYSFQFAGTSWHELNYIREAVGFLVIYSGSCPPSYLVFVCHRWFSLITYTGYTPKKKKDTWGDQARSLSGMKMRQLVFIYGRIVIFNVYIN